MSYLFTIEVNEDTSKLVQAILFEKDYSWAGRKEFKYTRYKFISVSENGDSFIYYGDSISKSMEKTVISLEDFIKWYQTGELPNRYKECVLSSNYVAKISKTEVVVGCQTFSKDVMVKFAKMVLEEMGDV